ncbi:MAG: NAD-binding protein, partial [Dehalococcoidia bacterium]|nr:NAD-binding protein [Dehalococcoidia bacterium]
MYIIVVGGGKVGYYLTQALLSEGHEVLVLEKDAKKCELIAEQLGSVCTRGDGCEARTLAEAGT